jgi:hypothetical protein
MPTETPSQPSGSPSEQKKYLTSSSPQRNRLDHIRRPPHTSIHKQLEALVRERDATLLLELGHDFDEDFDPGACEVELSTAVIGEDDAGEVVVEGF